MRLRTIHKKTPQLSLAFGVSAVCTVLGLFGCYDTEQIPAEPTPEPTGTSGASAESPTGIEAGATSGGRDGEEQPSSAGLAGAPLEASSGSGGTAGVAGAQSAVGSSAGAGALGGSAAIEEGGAPGGGSDNSGGTLSGDAGAPQGGDGPVEEPMESVCFDEQGVAVPYDYSFGLASEYAFELSMSCSVGGFLMPLVVEDPIELSQVTRFVSEATDWYRATILGCEGEESVLKADAYGLLPASQSSELSGADFDASLDLFLSVIDRHDGQPDAVSGLKKGHIKQRIKSIRERAVKKDTDDLTRTLSEPDCVPALPPEVGG